MDVEMNKRKKQKPASVLTAHRAGGQQAGKVYSCWRCAEPCVWTIRMLTTLISGVKGGRWFRLFDKVFLKRNLLTSFQHVVCHRWTFEPLDQFVRY